MAGAAMSRSQDRIGQKIDAVEKRAAEVERMQEAAADHEVGKAPVKVRERTGAQKRRQR